MKKEIPHPNYDDFSTDMDFMLVVLSSPALLSSDVSLVGLNSANSEPSVGDEVTVMGWGDTDISSASRLSDVLMHVKVNCISNDECDASTDGRDSYKDQITQNMLCAEHRQAKDSCQGDSGGPLVEEAGGVVKQVGVVSWGIGCASDHFPGVYARVSKAYKWIEGQVCNENKQYATEAGFDCANASPASASTSSVPAPAPAPAPSRPVPAPSPSWSFGSYWQPSPSSGSSGQGYYPSLYYDDDYYWDDDWRRE
jgi:trypsin